MANTVGKGFKRFDTDDASATFSETYPPRNPKVTSLIFASGGTGGTISLNVGGVKFLDVVLPVNTTYSINFGNGVNLPNLDVAAAIPATCAVTVIYE